MKAKELSRIDKEDGVDESVKESHNLKMEVQQYIDKINELEKRKEEIESIVEKKVELIDIKDSEMSVKIKEAR